MSRRHEAPMRELIEQIVSGETPPGEMLEREVDLALRFGVSRGVARECVRGLEERGLVVVKHGRGATVADPERWSVFDGDVLAVLLTSPAGHALVADVLACRRLVEKEAAALAAVRAGDHELDALADAVADMVAAAPHADASRAAMRRYRAARLSFHEALVRASGNRALPHLTQPLDRALEAADHRPDDVEADLAAHERLLTALRTRDAGAARAAVEAHLDEVAEHLQPC
jgi:DNA-binding FadR family transcriptional regulator